MAKSKDNTAWAFTGAFVLLGMGFGFLFGQLVAGIFIGVGLGILISVIAQLRRG